jgi:EAL domain-containing protein (putative c-di-GMP-specific phosphodiesterase class I)/CheY-like chemotaxis protein
MDNWANQVALVVEDSSVQRAHLVGLLQSLNFGTVLEACDGFDALRILDMHGADAVDLVITDLDMPVMDGIELIRHLTERQLTRQLIVTSARDPRMLEVVEKMGADDATLHLLGTVLKPVKLNDLLATLQKAEQIVKQRVGLPDRSRFDAGELEAGLAQGQFIPFFQPMVSVATGLVKGVEALARWDHPAHGVLQPLHFIPRIEGSPLMLPFTLSIVAQTLHQLSTWRRAGVVLPTVSINLSAENLADVSFVERLASLAFTYGVPPESLIWEVTETMVMSNLSQCLANLVRLRLKGFGLAMDDYGIGYSSMQQLSSCPFTELKIDRIFVDGAAERPNRRAVLESSIEMGHRLDAVTVAEGVESLPDWSLLQDLGCDIAQGYLIAKPMPAAELPDWITDNRIRLQLLAERRE